MSIRSIAAVFSLSATLGLVTAAQAQEKAAPPTDAPKPSADPAATNPDAPRPKPAPEKATFGGGCFWCIEAVYQRVPGVKSVVSGYAGGGVPNPTYEMVSSGLTGHAEVVQIVFDPSITSYETMVKLFFKSHDPTTLNAQGPDSGTQYRSIILYSDEAQRKTALKVYNDLKAHRAFRDPIVTELVPLTAFYPAEPYHQNYYRTHPYSDYSQAYIAPKLKKLKAK